MKNKHSKLNITLAVVQALSVFVLLYTLLIKSIFSSVESLNNTLSLAGAYNHFSAMVKQKLITNIPETKHTILTNAISIGIINAVVTPQLVERFSKPVLTAGIKILERPSNVENNQLIVNTGMYKQQIQQIAQTRDLPEFLAPVGQVLREAIPNRIVIMDLDKNPTGIIPTLVRAKTLYHNINTINTLAAITALLSLIGLIAINIHSIKRLLKSLALGYGITSIAALILSYFVPTLVPNLPLSVNADPVIRYEVNAMVNDIVNYFFTLTRTPSLYLLAGAGILYLLYRWAYVDRLQMNIDRLFTKKTAPASKKSKSSVKPRAAYR